MHASMLADVHPAYRTLAASPDGDLTVHTSSDPVHTIPLEGSAEQERRVPLWFAVGALVIFTVASVVFVRALRTSRLGTLAA